MSYTMTPKIDDGHKKRKASPECHAVSSSSSANDAGHELPDLRITALLSAAARLEPLKSIAEESVWKGQEANTYSLPVRRGDLTGGSNGEPGLASKAPPHSIFDMSEEQSFKRKRTAEKSTLYDPDLLAAIFRVQPTEAELEAANTDRTKGALLSWYDRLRELHMFKAKYGHAEVPQQYPENHALGIWVNKQRMQKRLRDKGQKVSLTDHRVNLLDAVGFQWAKEKGDASWDHHYNELYEFYLQNQHCDVPTKYIKNKALGRWVSTQRSQMKKWKNGSPSLMTNERYEKLCKLGFHFELLPPSRNKNSDDGSKNQKAAIV